MGDAFCFPRPSTIAKEFQGKAKTDSPFRRKLDCQHLQENQKEEKYYAFM
jgi:hypothetical protein